MDRATVTVYERSAPEWLSRRGDKGDGLGRHFRTLVGPGPVIDLGCGAGRYLAELGDPVVGVDATEAMLHLAARRERPLVRGDLEALPFADGAIAGLFARHSYLHVPKGRLLGAFSEALRVLRPGGTLLASLIGGSYEGYALPGDDFPGRFFALVEAAELRRLLEDAGFSDVAVERLERRRGDHDLLATARR